MSLGKGCLFYLTTLSPSLMDVGTEIQCRNLEVGTEGRNHGGVLLIRLSFMAYSGYYTVQDYLPRSNTNSQRAEPSQTNY